MTHNDLLYYRHLINVTNLRFFVNQALPQETTKVSVTKMS